MPDSFHSEQYKMFIALLRETREALKVSQAALASKLEQPQTFVSKCETGIRRLDVVELHAWLQALNVDFPKFVDALTKQWEAHTARTRLPRGVGNKQ